MNKYQKEKSREIRDIMRSDRFGRMTYKEAKRKWRKGIRAFPVGVLNAWRAENLAHLGFSRNKLLELGQAYHKLIIYCTARGLEFTCDYKYYFDSYELSFKGKSFDGRRYRVNHSVTGALLRNCKVSLVDLTDYILEKVNVQLREFTLPSVVKTDFNTESLYPRMILHDWKLVNPEAVFGKIIVKE